MSEPSVLWPLATIVVGVVAWLAIVRLQVGRIVSPFSIGMLVLLSIFGVRPFMMIGVGDYEFYGLDVRSGFNRASLVGFLAVACFVVGYLLNSRRGDDPIANREPRPARTMSIATAALVVAGCLALWLVGMVVVGGGPRVIPLLFAGRSSATRTLLTGVPVALAALPTAAALVMAYARISVERLGRLNVRERALYWGAMAATVVPSLAQGSRRFLLPVLLVAVIAAAVPRWKRLVSPVWVVLGLFLGLVLMAIPYIRSAGSRQGGPTDFVGALVHYGSGQGLSGVLSNYFLTYDTEMFNYVSYLSPRLGSSIPYGGGRGTLGDLLLNPLPAGLAPTRLWSDRLLSSTFGGTCATDVCPVPSLPGVLLYDLGIVGVVLGMLLAGVFAATVERRLPTSSGYPLLIWLGVAAFAPVLVRGNTINVIWILTNVVAIAAVAVAVVGTPAPRDRLRARERRADPVAEVRGHRLDRVER